ncbi:MAG TPA: hypothetical protein PK191_04400 [Niabella sp.]|nr:hypothetical protein [Niabella sp.]HOZ97824.1 hypothetical protein [Niabella sp.]HQW15663.1 hypothetical protein [Niabella sp.]HQX20820.1 hypothetical protein [Niabella sp.]HQX41405.1 hypothetical protein [Niabella sp.]
MDRKAIELITQISLQVIAEGYQNSYNYAMDCINFINLGGTQSGDILSTKIVGGFTGSLIGLYVTSNNQLVSR